MNLPPETGLVALGLLALMAAVPIWLSFIVSNGRARDDRRQRESDEKLERARQNTAAQEEARSAEFAVRAQRWSLISDLARSIEASDPGSSDEREMLTSFDRLRPTVDELKLLLEKASSQQRSRMQALLQPRINAHLKDAAVAISPAN